MKDHRQDLRKCKESNALHIHRRDNPGHSHDLKGARLLYASNEEAKRKIVESSLIATTDNCNIRPGEFPVCRLLAPVVLRSLRLEPKNTPVAPTSDDSRPNVPPSAVVTITAPSVASPPRSQVSSESRACTPPVAPPAIQGSPPDTTDTPQLQSQARALPIDLSHLISSPSFSPIGRRTRSRMRRRIKPLLSSSPHMLSQTTNPPPQHRPLAAPLALSPGPLPTASAGAIRKRRRSPVESPEAITGAIPKRRRNVLSSPNAMLFSPIITRFIKKNRIASNTLVNSSPARYQSQVT